MARCKFVIPNDVVRLLLADVHRRAYLHLETELANVESGSNPDKKIIRKLKQDLAIEASLLAEAETDGDWVDVKRELNAGEHDKMHAGVIKDLKAGETPNLDFEKVPSYKILAYVVGWSLVSPDGKSIASISESSLKNLELAARNEIASAVEWHDSQSERKIDERKNDDAPESPAASTSAER